MPLNLILLLLLDLGICLATLICFSPIGEGTEERFNMNFIPTIQTGFDTALVKKGDMLDKIVQVGKRLENIALTRIITPLSKFKGKVDISKIIVADIEGLISKTGSNDPYMLAWYNGLEYYEYSLSYLGVRSTTS
jgi:hypothetical protein